MKKAFLKQIPLLLLLLTIVFSCQNDDDLEDNTNLQSKSKVLAKRVTLNEIKENSQLRQSITKIENQFDYIKRNNINSKINSTDNSFAILTDEILQVSTDSTEAFTFRIEIPTHTDSSFENFVIEKHNENEYEFYIYRYKLLELEGNIEVTHSISKESVSAEQINLGDFQDILNAKVMVYDEGSGCLFDITYNDDCTCEYAEVFWCPESSGGGGGSGSSGSGSGSTGGSTGSGSGSTGGSTGSGSTGGSTGGGYGGSTGGGGYNGGSGGPNPGSGVGGSTIGVLPSLNSQIIKQFFLNLDQDQKDCLNSNLDVKNDVSEFLDNNLGPIDVNGNGIDAEAMSTDIINLFCDNSDINNFDDAIKQYFNNYFSENPEEFIPTYDIAPNDIIDINDYMDCFNSASSTDSFSMTIYVEQPNPGTRDPYVVTNYMTQDVDVGHTFVSLSMTNLSGTTVTQTVGFYPDPNNLPSVDAPNAPSVFVDNGQHAYDVSITTTLNLSQFNNTITYLEGLEGSTYNLNTLNCTDVGITSAGQGGLTLPDTTGNWSMIFVGSGSGSNPGDLGEDIRGINNPSTPVSQTASIGPLSNGPCN